MTRPEKLTPGNIKCWMIAFLALLSTLTSVIPARAQTATPPTPRDVLIQAITQQAQSDEKQGTKESTEGLSLLFGEQAKQAGMTLSEVKKIYEDTYNSAAAARPWWADLTKDWLPSLGWLAAIVALLTAIFRKKIEDAGEKFANSLGERLYNRFAGYKPFWMLALWRYKAALYEKHHELKLPFRPGRPLEMQEVYVPVKVKDQDALTDAYQAIEKHKKLVVLGAPGAGKSILLRHVALTYAERDLDEPLVPVLVELNRLNDAGTKMFDQIVVILKQNDFPNGENFLKAWLKTGQLLLMFDGLDEVNTDRREQVSVGIRDLLAEYPGCHAIVTCRTQVYRGEFADWADQTLEVAEFSDQQIQRFLFAWQKELPSDKSVEHLLANLSERPRILALARNPLMLTIIAFLYADTEFVLPHSRAEFYDTAVTVLLEQWKEKRNRYKAASKRLVMQHLALFMQDTAAQRGQERRTIDLPVLLAEIKKVLPALNLKDDEAQPLLDEIVERSGLIFTLEGGLKYQFTHLTLQEFFAAHALGDNAAGLLQRFIDDPDVWREVVKLWCGLERDCTALLTEIYIFDPLTAFECLADAQKIDPVLADKLIDEFKARISVGESDDAVLHSIANVAADRRLRGKKLQDFLVTTASNADAPVERVESAAKALAFTNLPNVGEIIVRLAEANPNIRSFAVAMGDRVVPSLAKLLDSGNDWALDALYQIGTPFATQMLVSILWTDTYIAYQAAWCVAALLPQADIESSLLDMKLTPEQRKTNQIGWIWAPFDTSATSSLVLIAGRIAHLLHTTPEKQLPTSPLPCDPRLALPLCAIAAQKDQIIKEIKADKRDELLKEAKEQSFVAKHIHEISTHLGWRRLFSDLPAPLRSKVLVSLIQNEPIPNEDDWRNLYHPSDYVFAKSWQAGLLKGLLWGLALLNLGSIAWQVAASPVLLTLENAAAVGIGILVLASVCLVQIRKWTIIGLEISLFIVACGLGSLFGAIVGGITGNWWSGAQVGALSGMMVDALSGIVLHRALGRVQVPALSAVLVGALVGALIGALVGALIGALVGLSVGAPVNTLIIVLIVYLVATMGSVMGTPMIGNLKTLTLSIAVGAVADLVFAYFPTIFLYTTVGLPFSIIFWLIWTSVFCSIYWIGKREERRAQNPMHQFVQYLPNAPKQPRSSLSKTLETFQEIFFPSDLMYR